MGCHPLGLSDGTGMPVLHGTLGTSRSGERQVVVSTDVGQDVGRIEFPLDHVALTARRVGAHSAAQLWAEAVRAAWRLAGGVPLPENACDNVREVAARALGRLPTTASVSVSIEVVSSGWDGDWVLEAITDRPIAWFQAEMYLPKPIIPGYSWRSRHGLHIAVGDRVHAFDDLDGELIDHTSHRLGGGIHTRVRTVDGRVIHRRPSAVRRASQRDVIVTNGQAVHTFAAKTEAMDSSGPNCGVALLALVHGGCPCEELTRQATKSASDAPDL